MREGIPTQHRAIKRGFASGVSTSSVTKKRVRPSITHKAGIQRVLKDCRQTRTPTNNGQLSSHPQSLSHPYSTKLRYVQGTGIQVQPGRAQPQPRDFVLGGEHIFVSKNHTIIQHAPSHLPEATARSTRPGTVRISTAHSIQSSTHAARTP